MSIHHGGRCAGDFVGDVGGKCDDSSYPIKQINAMVQLYMGGNPLEMISDQLQYYLQGLPESGQVGIGGTPKAVQVFRYLKCPEYDHKCCNLTHSFRETFACEKNDEVIKNLEN